MKKVLGVFRDVMSVKMGLPVLKVLVEQGDQVSLAVESKAVDLAEESGLPIVLRGSDGLGRLCLVQDWLRETKPDAVVVGCSIPINWELEVAVAARALSIPVVVCEDIWGALSRLQGFKPDLALVMDDFATKGGESACNYVVIGDIASTVNPVVPDDKRGQAARLETSAKEKIVVLIVGDHTRNALELVALVTESIRLESNPNQFVITHSLIHPKLVGTSEGNEILGPAIRLFGGLEVDQFGGLSTDARAVRCTITVTAYSTPGRIALHRGKRFVSAWGPESHKLHEEENKFSIYPLVVMDVVPILYEPRPFSNIDWFKYDTVGHQWAEQAKFRPEDGAEAIRQLAA